MSHSVADQNTDARRPMTFEDALRLADIAFAEERFGDADRLVSIAKALVKQALTAGKLEQPDDTLPADLSEVQRADLKILNALLGQMERSGALMH